MIISPKTRFGLSDQNISRHRTMVDQPEFQRACDYAMLHFAQALSLTNLSEEERTMGAAGLKLRGAHEFMEIFKNLSEKPKNIVPIPRTDNLNHA